MTCRLADPPASTPAGSYQLLVSVPGLGYAAGAPAVTIDLLSIFSAAPTTVAAAGWTRLTVMGSGFDPTCCGCYVVLVGSVQCEPADCSATYVQALFPGGVVAAAAPIRVLLLLPGSSNGTSNSTVVLDRIQASVTVSVATSAPQILSINSPTWLPSSSGGAVVVTLSASVAPAQVAAMYLVPQWLANGTANSTSAQPAAAAALASRVPCSNLTASGAQQLSCTTGSAVPIGAYNVAVEVPGSPVSPNLLLGNSTLQFDFTVAAVSPSDATVGGGTLLSISGSGFPTSSSNGSLAVYIRVPPSITSPDGVLPCDVVNITSTQISCRTRPYLAVVTIATAVTNITSLVAMPTPSAAVQLLACGPAAAAVNTTPAAAAAAGGAAGFRCAGFSRSVEARCVASNASLCSFQ